MLVGIAVLDIQDFLKWCVEKRNVVKNWYRSLSYKFSFLKIYFSPFKNITPNLYFGKIAIGTPIFLPRKTVLNKEKNVYNFVPKKVGFDFVALGWKTKWHSKDFRFEWNPVWSFVFFGYQIAFVFRPEHPDHYWECWLYYEKATDKSKTKRERIEQAKKEFPCVWTDQNGTETNYWEKILQKKWI